jgi:hypothetical protein
MVRSAGLLVVFVWASMACASGGSGEGGGGYVSTPGRGGGSQQIRFGPGGRVFGENFELTTTENGYRGMLYGELTTMQSEDGERVTGTRGGSPIDLHIEVDGSTIKASGMFAARLGRLHLDPSELTSTFGRCSMQLRRHQARVYAGQRACGDGYMAPAVVEMPPELTRLPPYRLVMLLAMLLYL